MSPQPITFIYCVKTKTQFFFAAYTFGALTMAANSPQMMGTRLLGGEDGIGHVNLASAVLGQVGTPA